MARGTSVVAYMNIIPFLLTLCLVRLHLGYCDEVRWEYRLPVLVRRGAGNQESEPSSSSDHYDGRMLNRKERSWNVQPHQVHELLGKPDPFPEVQSHPLQPEVLLPQHLTKSPPRKRKHAQSPTLDSPEQESPRSKHPKLAPEQHPQEHTQPPKPVSLTEIREHVRHLHQTQPLLEHVVKELNHGPPLRPLTDHERLEQEVTKRKALSTVRSFGPHNLSQLKNRLRVPVELPGFKRKMQIGQVVNSALLRPWPADYREPWSTEVGSWRQKLTPHEAKRMDDIRRPKPVGNERPRLLEAFREARGVRRVVKAAADQLGNAGIPAVDHSHRRPPKVNRTPRTNPTSWQGIERQVYATADWKQRVADELSSTRYASLNLQNDWFRRDARAIGKDRAELHLPRSMSDMTHEVHDEHQGEWEDRQEWRRVVRTTSHRGEPAESTQILKERVLYRPHSIGYPGEVTRDNRGSTQVDIMHNRIKKGRDGTYVDIPERWENLMGEGV